ncbi:hypothetical protein GCM10010517_25110 [Streptosporangium fragile]|uniref:Leucine-rich repeat domain-containing protein n=1 Tax=Streptosporangium fragile TaxID=46186 RepID=A0ABN3VVT3_9ACTN
MPGGPPPRTGRRTPRRSAPHALNVPATGLTALPESPGELAGLSSADLAWNELDRLPGWVGGLSELVHLQLDGNRLRRLTHLDLRNNRLREVPDVLGDLPALEKLDLRWNKLGRQARERSAWNRGCRKSRERSGPPDRASPARAAPIRQHAVRIRTGSSCRRSRGRSREPGPTGTEDRGVRPDSRRPGPRIPGDLAFATSRRGESNP